VIALPPGASGATAVDVARRAAQAAADATLPRFRTLTRGDPIEKVAKGRGNYVTESDLACEAAVMAILREEYPDVPVLSEETSDTVDGWDQGWLWVMDPIDGTHNFARGIPSWAFNLALCHDGEPVLGLTYQPVTGDEFLATRGGGLFVNGERTRVSPIVALEDALTAFGLGYDYDRAGKILSLLSGLWPRVMMIQNIGTAALGLAYAASGRFDLYVHSLLFPWDMAPGLIQIQEAGGVTLARDGSPANIYSEGIIAGAPGPAAELLALTKDRPWR